MRLGRPSWRCWRWPAGALAQQQPPPAADAAQAAGEARRTAGQARRRAGQARVKFTPPAFKITVATEAAYPPFNYLDRKGLPAGFEMELAQEACQRMKAECEFVAVKWDDLIPGLSTRSSTSSCRRSR